MSCIVILDESADCARLAAKLLEHVGHEVYITQDSPTALDVIVHVQPDLVLVDVDMQYSLAGRALVEAIRVRTPRAHRMSIVSYLSLPQDQAASLAAYCGCDGVISKPIDTRTFIGQINYYLGEALIRARHLN